MTGLFGGLDLGTPAERNRRALTADLELRRKNWRPLGGKDSRAYVYRGTGDLLLQHGRFYPGRELPERYTHLMGTEGNCFENCILAALHTPELRYCEGCYWTGQGYPMAHGWCVDPDGGLVELTLPSDPASVARMRTHDANLPYMSPEHWAYWGAVFTPELAIAHMQVLGAPMMARSPAEVQRAGPRYDMSEPHDFPIFQLPYDAARKDWPWPLEPHELTPTP